MHDLYSTLLFAISMHAGSLNYFFCVLWRKKTRWELVRVSTAVMGIEFSYAAETAFVSPTLLEIGVEHSKMSLVWALSPLVGFFITPLLGSLSDRCHLSLGRRRPFIVLLSLGVLIGNLIVCIADCLHNVSYASDHAPTDTNLRNQAMGAHKAVQYLKTKISRVLAVTPFFPTSPSKMT